ncbi:MAG TPA: hypothetical protein VFN19_07380 [Candidatus Nanopelagicales bacterium]|nr:hypothetical protein [Candidatus Nanopelagicales bacterium]
MLQRWWYLRRGVAWQSVLGCCAAAAVAALLLARWPDTAVLLLPALLAALAAAAAFLFDEASTSVVGVTARGTTWRSTTRLAAALLPLGLWCAVIAVRPGDLAFSRPGWWLLGTATILLATGLGAVSARPENPTPGPVLAGLLALAVLAPVVVSGFLGVPIPFPLEGFPDSIRTFWVVVGGVAVVTCAAGCTHVTPRRRSRPGSGPRLRGAPTEPA